MVFLTSSFLVASLRVAEVEVHPFLLTWKHGALHAFDVSKPRASVGEYTGEQPVEVLFSQCSLKAVKDPHDRLRVFMGKQKDKLQVRLAKIQSKRSHAPWSILSLTGLISFPSFLTYTLFLSTFLDIEEAKTHQFVWNLSAWGARDFQERFNLFSICVGKRRKAVSFSWHICSFRSKRLRQRCQKQTLYETRKRRDCS